MRLHQTYCGHGYGHAAGILVDATLAATRMR